MPDLFPKAHSHFPPDSEPSSRPGKSKPASTHTNPSIFIDTLRGSELAIHIVVLLVTTVAEISPSGHRRFDRSPWQLICDQIWKEKAGLMLSTRKLGTRKERIQTIWFAAFLLLVFGGWMQRWEQERRQFGHGFAHGCFRDSSEWR